MTECEIHRENPDNLLGKHLATDVLAPLKRAFVGKDEIIDLLGVCLAGGENLFLLGPPGTAKSAIVQELGGRIDGKVFDYLLTRFTEPNELFGPFDIRRLREGELVTNTEGMLPEAGIVFLDELLNANSAILNSLLLVLNERVFRRGRETRRLPLLMVVGASNRLPEDDALNALFDRFLLRVRCDNVSTDRLAEVLEAGWRLECRPRERKPSITMDDIRAIQQAVQQVNVVEVRESFSETIRRLRNAGISVSDRRAVKLQRMIAASAVLCGRGKANTSDLWVLRYIWDSEEQIEVIAAIVESMLAKTLDADWADSHPRARNSNGPDPEELARDLDSLADRVRDERLVADQRDALRDQLALLSGRCQWIKEEQKRQFLEAKVNGVWNSLGRTD